MAAISTPEYLLDQAKRRFTPSINNFPGLGAVEKKLLQTDFKQMSLAEPPPGSDLKQVMGDAGLPVFGHMIEMFRGGPEFLMHLYRKNGPVSFADSPALPAVVALGPDAAQTIYTNRNKDYSQKGWLPAIGPFFKRGLMLLDFDEHMYHRRIMQEAFTRTRLTGYVGACRRRRHPGDQQRLGGKRRPFPALSGDEGAHPRHRLDGVHGPRTRHRQEAGDQGQQGLHHDGAGGQRGDPHQRSAVHVVARSAGPRSCSRTTSPSASKRPDEPRAPICCRCCASPRTKTATNSPTRTSSAT